MKHKNFGDGRCWIFNLLHYLFISVLRRRGGTLRRNSSIGEWNWWCLVHCASHEGRLRAKHVDEELHSILSWGGLLPCLVHLRRYVRFYRSTGPLGLIKWSYFCLTLSTISNLLCKPNYTLKLARSVEQILNQPPKILLDAMIILASKWEYLIEAQSVEIVKARTVFGLQNEIASMGRFFEW